MTFSKGPDYFVFHFNITSLFCNGMIPVRENKGNQNLFTQLVFQQLNHLIPFNPLSEFGIDLRINSVILAVHSRNIISVIISSYFRNSLHFKLAIFIFFPLFSDKRVSDEFR